MTAPGRPRGRPRVADETGSVNVHLRLPGKSFDRSQKRAALDRLTLAEWLRMVVDRASRQK